MKITGKGWFWIFLGILGTSVVALLAVGFWLFFQLSAQTVPAEMSKPTDSDRAEGKRKLQIIEQSTQRQGYVDFSEGELNSLIHELYFAKKKLKEPKIEKPSTNVWRLNKTRIKLSENSITCYSWVSRKFMGKEWDFCWARTVTLSYGSNQWQIALQSVRIGDREVPFKHWLRVFENLGMADEPMIEKFQWFRGLPWVELYVDRDKPIPVIRLYNYIPKPGGPAAK